MAHFLRVRAQEFLALDAMPGFFFVWLVVIVPPSAVFRALNVCIFQEKAKYESKENIASVDLRQR